MPYADKAKEAEYQRNRWIENKAKRAGKVDTRESTGDSRGKNRVKHVPWKEIKPWERLGIK